MNNVVTLGEIFAKAQDCLTPSFNSIQFESDVDNLSKSETENLLGTIQSEILKGGDYDVLTEMRSIALDHIADIEKARQGVYADNAQNRRLMRVGQQYGQTSNTFKPGNKVRATLPTGKVIEAVYVEPYGKDKHTVKLDGKLYGVATDKLEKIAGQSKGRKLTYTELAAMEDRLDNYKQQIKDLQKERKQTEVDMEEELGQLSDAERSDGNNKLVAYYGEELDRIDGEIAKVTAKYKKQKETLSKHGW